MCLQIITKLYIFIALKHVESNWEQRQSKLWLNITDKSHKNVIPEQIHKYRDAKRQKNIKIYIFFSFYHPTMLPNWPNMLYQGAFFL